MKRVVIKVGTSTLTHGSGHINIRRVEKLVKVISDLQNAGNEILLVSSGAIGVGMGKLGLPERPTDLPSKQALAAIGQCELMYLYDKLFSEYNRTVAQVLLTNDAFSHKSRSQHMKNTLLRLLEMRVIPIINENDTVAVEEILVGDNDTLSAMVAKLVQADTLLLMSDIDGFYDKNPSKHLDAVLLLEVDIDDASMDEVAGGAGSNRGTGGMITKLHAARIAVPAGAATHVLNGKDPDILYDVFEGDKVGTEFVRKA